MRAKKKTSVGCIIEKREQFGPNLPSAAILKATTNSLFISTLVKFQ
jgi:hypothetical protein